MFHVIMFLLTVFMSFTFTATSNAEITKNTLCKEWRLNVLSITIWRVFFKLTLILCNLSFIHPEIQLALSFLGLLWEVENQAQCTSTKSIPTNNSLLLPTTLTNHSSLTEIYRCAWSLERKIKCDVFFPWVFCS